MEDELDRAERDFEKIMNEENKRISNFIVRGIKNKNWHTMEILEAYSIEEARRMALTIYEEPLIVMDLTLWMHSDEVVKRNLEEIVMAKQKRKNEEAKWGQNEKNW